MIKHFFFLFLIIFSNSYANYGTPAGEKVTKFEKEIQNSSRKHGVKSAFIKGIIKQESNFNPNARSHVGAMGLMQLMPGTARDMGVKNPFNPQQNVYGGTKYINRMLKMFYGNPCLALAAYNWGPGNMRKLVRKKGTTDCKALIPFMPKETQNYIIRVTRYTKQYGLNLGTDTSELEEAADNPPPDGEYVPRGQQTRFTAFYEKFFTKLIGVSEMQSFLTFQYMKYQIINLLNILLTLWVLIQAYNMAQGRLSLDDFIYQKFKTIFIIALATNFNKFNSIIAGPIEYSTDLFLFFFFPDSTSIGEALDLFSARMAISLNYQLQAATNIGNEFMLTAIYHIFNWLMSLFAGAYSLGKLGSAICYFFGPLALILYLFETTKEFTTRWLQLFLFFSILKLIVTVILYFMFSIGLNAMSTNPFQNLSDFLEPMLLFLITGLMFKDAARFTMGLAGAKEIIFPGLIGRNLLRKPKNNSNQYRKKLPKRHARK